MVEILTRRFYNNITEVLDSHVFQMKAKWFPEINLMAEFSFLCQFGETFIQNSYHFFFITIRLPRNHHLM